MKKYGAAKQQHERDDEQNKHGVTPHPLIANQPARGMEGEGNDREILFRRFVHDDLCSPTLRTESRQLVAMNCISLLD